MNNDQIIQKIKNENLKPISKYFFLFKKIITWFLLVITTIFGAYAFAFFFIKTLYIDFENWIYFSDSYNTFVLSKIPILWVLLFIISICLIFYLFKNTNKGYKYSVILIAFASLFISFSLGIVLSKILIQNARFVESIERERMINWMKPESGRVSGEVLFIDNNFVLIRDIRNEIWSIDISHILENSKDVLMNNKIISVIGLYNYENNFFTACQIIPFEIDQEKFNKNIENLSNSQSFDYENDKKGNYIKDVCDFVINID